MLPYYAAQTHHYCIAGKCLEKNVENGNNVDFISDQMNVNPAASKYLNLYLNIFPIALHSTRATRHYDDNNKFRYS